MTKPIRLSERSLNSHEAPISYLMEQGLANPGVISLAAGFVDQETLPTKELESAVQEIAHNPKRGRDALQYGTTHGLPPLREIIVNRLNDMDGIADASHQATVHRCVLGTGSQQLLYILGEILLNPGDIVLAGVPTYFVYMGALQSFGAEIIPVQTDEHGLVPADLDRKLEQLSREGKLSRVKFLYDVTYFCNPTGLTLSLDRRPRIVEIIKRWSTENRILIVEDAAYREIRYLGEDIPSLLRFDESGEFVIYAGTFSKPFAPGVRTGYMIVPADLVKPFVQQKGHHDFGSANLTQQILLSVLQSGDYDRHLSSLRKTYSEKLQMMLDVLSEQLGTFGPQVTWTRPDGGLYVWLRLPKSIDTSGTGTFFKDCIAAGVLYVPGNFCFPTSMEEMPTSFIRLSFGFQPLERCREGLLRFTRVAREYLARESNRREQAIA
ncbi:PLP-dependent aminotransferase family protein [bacterium]|nr:PLP-dependent aminotransferase family protein [bacterium]